MADIRINALATTAASTASDDFVAVDGSANGTRKLNAYSPTFGGNLILGGTKLQLIAGANPYIQNGTTLGYLQLNDDGTVKLASSASNKTITLANGPVAMDGNLTVSGGTISSGVGNDLTLQQVNYGGGLTALASGQVKIAAFNGQSVRLQTQGADALTLDSSQRCILAGALRLNNAYTAGAPTATGYVTLQDSAGNTYKVLVGT